jgi:hypothetical protein
MIYFVSAFMQAILNFQIDVEHFVPGQSVFADFFHKRVGIEFFHIEDTFSAPFSGEHHHGAKHGRYAGGVRNALSSGFLVGNLMAAVVPDVIGLFFPVFNPFNAAADGGFAGVVFSQFARIGKNSFQKFERDYIDTFIFNGSIRDIPMFWITRRWVRYSSPKSLIQKRARFSVG